MLQLRLKFCVRRQLIKVAIVLRSITAIFFFPFRCFDAHLSFVIRDLASVEMVIAKSIMEIEATDAFDSLLTNCKIVLLQCRMERKYSQLNTVNACIWALNNAPIKVVVPGLWVKVDCVEGGLC